MAGWAVLPVELLQRIAAHGEVLPLRLVCVEWAKNLAECVVSASLGIACEEADASPTSPGLPAPVVEDVQRLSVFGSMRKLDISQLPASAAVIAHITALSQLCELHFGSVEACGTNWLELTHLTALTLLKLSTDTRERCSQVLPVSSLLSKPGMLKYSLHVNVLEACRLKGLWHAEMLTVLQQLQSLCITCCAAAAEFCTGLGLPSNLTAGQTSGLEINGNIGMSEADVVALQPLGLRHLRAQLCSAEAYLALTSLTSLNSLTVADWTPGPSGPRNPNVWLSLEHFSQLGGLTRLDVIHTFGNFQVIELDGLAELTQLQELAIHIPFTLEDTAQLLELDKLSARVRLSKPFDASLDGLGELTCVTSLCFQDILPVAEEGELDDVPREICMGFIRGLTRLEELRICRNARQVVGEGLFWLSGFRNLTYLCFGSGNLGSTGWSADDPDVWSQSLALLSSLKVLEIAGCDNLRRLDLSGMTQLNSLSLPGCSSLGLQGRSSMASLHSLDVSFTETAARQSLAEAEQLSSLRFLSIRGCKASQEQVQSLLRMTCLRSLDVRNTHLPLPGLAQLERLPYLVRLLHSA